MMTRIVMMKMIRSTNITSTRGVTLMSDITSPSLSPPTFSAMECFLSSSRRGRLDYRRRPVHAQSHLGARDQVGVQFMGEMTDAFLHALVAAQENVVTQHRRHRD